MHSESNPPDAPENEVQKTIAYVDNAIRITSGRIHDKYLLKEVVDIFDSIRILCEMHFDKARELQLLAAELLMGAAESGHEKNSSLLNREIEYVREKLEKFFN